MNGRRALLDRLCPKIYHLGMAGSERRQSVKIYPRPTEILPGSLDGGVAIVIDVLRASTTIATALANGATRVMPCGDLETARRLAKEDSTGNTLTGGERGGVKIEDFDLDNSPASYSREQVAGKTIAFTTTNGTAALLRTDGAARVLIGALVNRGVIAEVLHADGRPIHLICAGTDGRVTSEDLLGAGAIAAALAQFDDVELADDATERAAKTWLDLRSHQVLPFLRRSSGGCNLVSLGLDQDIVGAAKIDSVPVVPEYSSSTRAIQIDGGLSGVARA
ncbi:MAG TPA: 2-phosphosulfolactate phosphatase [Planctomycetaceae bacterium]|jgi:2-phosphosulfolactate phosphatase|nr:2-phosphosulfolactate phosphatase [Planctomycetaceae bacterium]